MSMLKDAATAAVVYLRDSPGAVALIVSEAVLAFTRLGVHVAPATLYQVGAIMLPLVLGYFHVAKTASAKAAAKQTPAP